MVDLHAAPGPAPTPATAPPSYGALRLTLQGNRVLDNPRGPQVVVDGYPVVTTYGDNVVPLPAGPATVEVHCQWLRRYGEATASIEVPADGEVHLFYAAPMHELAAGAIGPERQKRPGGEGALIASLLTAYVLVFLLNLLLR